VPGQDIPAEEDARAARYRSLLAGRQILVVADNAGSVGQVRPLLPGTPGCVVVVTSRDGLAGLVARDGARRLDLDLLPLADAAGLLRDLIGGRVETEPEAVKALAAQCSRLPLALRLAAELAAARPAFPLARLVAELANRRQRLDLLDAGGDQRTSLRAVFSWSYRGLDAGAARAARPMSRADVAVRGTGVRADQAFRRLALADGPDIGLPAAAALLGVPLDQAKQALELLVDSYLLQSAASLRYRFHDLLRVYAAERVRAEENAAERDAAVRRLLEWYLRTALEAARFINPRRSPLTLGPPAPGTDPLAFASNIEALAWLEAEHANLVAAVGQASRQGPHEVAWMLAVTLWDLLNLRGHREDWLATHETGLARARLLRDRHAEQWTLSHLGGALTRVGRPLAAIECLRQALPIQRELGDLRVQAIGLHNLGLTLTELGRTDEAMGPLQEALGLFREGDNRSGEGSALAGIAGIYRRRGQFSDAIAEYQGALDAFRQTNDLINEGDTLVQLSAARLMAGQLDAAIREATAAVELNRQSGHRYDEAGAMAVLGQAQLDRGYPEQARKHLLDAFAIFADLGHPRAAEVSAGLNALGPPGPGESASRHG
jgi:tetratricopeptide (TPR) repeat protein